MRVVYLLPFLVAFCLSDPIEEGEVDWWQSTIFYQIYPRSYADSNGDGIGDLNGITSKLEYIKEIGVGAIWLSPIFQSPMYDFGYDIADFYAIHDEYGTMADFEALTARAAELGIKVVLDLVPNHSSNESEWFKKALEGDSKYYNYFVWEDGVIDENGNRQPPNNWLSHFHGSAWEYRAETDKYYLHQFVIGQPDLNYRNPELVAEMNNVVRHWLGKGVAGFRVDAANTLFEVDKELFNGTYPDEPLSGAVGVELDDHDSLNHIYTKNQNETYYIIYDWRDILDEFKAQDGMSRTMMTEVYATIQDVVKYFGVGGRNGAQMPFNFDLITDVNADSSAPDIKRAIDKFLTYKPLDKDANWVVGNHDNHRMATRYGATLVDGINMIVLLLPGVGVTYMGEEIGLLDGEVTWEETVDPAGCNTDPDNYMRYSRDPERTPMQWNAQTNAGFSNASTTWLPVASNYRTLNVEAQLAATRSHLKNYQALAKLRLDRVFRLGRFESLALNEDVFAFKRWYNGEVYLVVVNMRDTAHDVNLTHFENVEGDVTVVIRSVDSTKNEGEVFSASSIPLAGYEAVVWKAQTSGATELKSLSIVSLCFVYLLVYFYSNANN
ncbi:maltase A1-like [Cydia splendana]|uniref:maltase A1-like n=1 Tax=Cydia splendana TaxID=1100963 RepID=UPI00212BE0DF